ncbi:cytochrome c oxidase accessory protein CcoG, partial [Aliarcobacter trophiarum LMG 25534]
KIKEDNVVANNFLLLFQNTDSKTHTYNIEIVGRDDITIERFRPFKLQPGRLRKKVVILQTDKILVNDKTKDTPITVKLRAYAVDEPDKISVFRDAVFIYPRADKLK